MFTDNIVRPVMPLLVADLISAQPGSSLTHFGSITVTSE